MLLAVLLKFVMAFINSHISMPGGQFSHFRDKMSLARDTGHHGSIPGRSRPFWDGWQAYFWWYNIILTPRFWSTASTCLLDDNNITGRSPSTLTFYTIQFNSKQIIFTYLLKLPQVHLDMRKYFLQLESLINGTVCQLHYWVAILLKLLKENSTGT